MSSKYVLPITLSFAIHIVLAAVLLLGDFASPKKVTPKVAKIDPIQAVAVDKSQIEAQLNKLRKQKADAEKRVKDRANRIAEKKKQRLREKRRKKEREKQRKKKAKEAAAKKAKAAEKLRKQKLRKEKEKQKKQAAAKAKRQKEERARKAEQQRKKKAAEKKRQEQVRKEKIRKAQEAKERAAEQKMLEQEMAEEMASRQKARRQQMMTEIARFQALIGQAIQRNFLIDEATMKGKSCKLTISLARSGFVTNVVIGKGNRTVCEAAKNAVYKAGTLPVSKDPEVFREMKTISLLVAPDTFN